MRILEDFFGWLESERNYSDYTISSYRRDISSFLAWRGVAQDDFVPEMLSRAIVLDWAIYRFDTLHHKATTINRGMAALRTLARWMYIRNITPCNVLKLLKHFKPPKRLPTFVPETRMDDVVSTLCYDAESEQFLSLRNALIVFMIYTSGLRLSEIAGANVGDLSSDYSAIRIMGKGRKVRVQPLVASLKPLLERYIATRPATSGGEGDPLFVSERGVRFSRRGIERVVGKVLKEAGVSGKASPHVLRHTFATHLLNRGADLREIQELLGHESLRATQIYTHTDIEKLKNIFHIAHPHETGGE